MSLSEELEAMAQRAASRALELAEGRIERAVAAALEKRDADRLMTLEEVATLLGRSPAAFRAYMYRSSGEAFRAIALKHGAALRWRRAEVLDLVDQHGRRRVA